MGQDMAAWSREESARIDAERSKLLDEVCAAADELLEALEEHECMDMGRSERQQRAERSLGDALRKVRGQAPQGQADIDKLFAFSAKEAEQWR